MPAAPKQSESPKLPAQSEQSHVPEPPRLASRRGSVAASIARAAFRPSLRSVPFWSCFVYSPKGSGYGSEASRQLCARLKLVDPAWLPTYAAQVREQVSRNPAWARLFERPAVLVPVPSSSVPPGPVWAAEQLAFALRGIGLAKSVWTGINRHCAVRKSATARNLDRPTVQQHYESFAIAATLPESSHLQRIILVDDVITKGRTIFAAALRLHEAFPNADIRAFALVRTMGFLSNITHSLDPCHGVVRWAGGDVYREP